MDRSRVALEKLETSLRLMADSIAELRREDEWVDQTTSPLGRRRHLEAARRGDFATRKVHGRVYARRADVDAYIERAGQRAPSLTDADDDARNVAAVLQFRAPARRRASR